MRNAFAAIVLVLSATAVSEATPIVDYSFMPGLSEHADVQFGAQFAQTFLVGTSGLMTGLDLTIGRETRPQAMGDIVIAILGTNGSGLPDLANVLATTTLPASYWVFRDSVVDVDSYRHLDVAPFAVSAGELLAVSIRQAAPTADHFYWYGSGDEAAPGALFNLLGTNWNEMSAFDIAFQTYVDPNAAQPVPEPATLGLLSLGLAGFAARRARQARLTTRVPRSH